MTDAHALLSPSSAYRWMECTASVDMTSRVEDIETEYAREGTDAHTIAEIKAAYELGMIDPDTYAERLTAWRESTPEAEQADMLEYADDYVAFLQELVDETEGAHVLLEQRVDTGVPFCWGTADAVIVGADILHVVDFKYGMGVLVYATENPQIMLYGVGALDTFDVINTIEHVDMHIFQPRVDNGVSSFIMPAAELRDWRDHVVIPLAEEALGDHPRFKPTDKACRFCPAAGECKPRMRHVTRRDFGDPDLLTPEELAEALAALPQIRAWANAVDAAAIAKAYDGGVKIPGFKVVLSGGKRSIPNGEAAVEALVEAGYERDKVSRVQAETLGVLEKIVGKAKLPQVLGDLLAPGTPKPSLVPEDDDRPAWNALEQAREDFK